MSTDPTRSAEATALAEKLFPLRSENYANSLDKAEAQNDNDSIRDTQREVAILIDSTLAPLITELRDARSARDQGWSDIKDLSAQNTAFKQMLYRICEEAFGNEDTKSNESADDYVIRQVKSLRERLAAAEGELKAIAFAMSAVEDWYSGEGTRSLQGQVADAVHDLQHDRLLALRTAAAEAREARLREAVKPLLDHAERSKRVALEANYFEEAALLAAMIRNMESWLSATPTTKVLIEASEVEALRADRERLEDLMDLKLIETHGTSVPDGQNVTFAYVHRDSVDSAIASRKAAKKGA